MPEPAARHPSPSRNKRHVPPLAGPLFLVIGCAWPLSGLDWRIDLIANLNAQWLVLCLPLAIIAMLRRRWLAALLSLLACGLLAAPLLMSRAAFFPRSSEPTPRPADYVRILHYNARGNGTSALNMALIDAVDADIVSIVAPPVQQQFEVIYGDGLEARFPGKLIRTWKPSPDNSTTLISPMFLVSKWPLLRLDSADLGEQGEHLTAGIVQRPGGQFAVIAIHPRSPRNQLRWLEGNQTIETTFSLARRVQAKGLPLIIVADLNSTPSGWRSREVCSQLDLIRCKPFFDVQGTYPEEIPLGTNIRTAPALPAFWPLRIAIDDIWMTPQIRVDFWKTLPTIASEHRPIVVGVRIPLGLGDSAGGSAPKTAEKE